MLLQFKFNNFKSFKDEAIIDMTATSISEYKSHVTNIGNENILPIAAIYGANASGKSNIFEAFQYMSFYVLESLTYGNEGKKRNENSKFEKPTPFLFDSKSKTDVSSFEVYFIESEQSGAKTFNYGFTVNDTGVCEEWLNYKTKSSRGDFRPIFYRNGQELDLSGLPQKSRENISVALERETLVVSLGAKLKVDILKQVYDWFMDNECINFGKPMENYILSNFIPPDFATDKTVRDNVIKYFHAFDPSIVDFNVDYSLNDEGHEKILIDAVHQTADGKEVAAIPLRSESAGTLKMFTLYPFLEDVMKAGSVLFVDELNSRLHPLLLRLIISTFVDPEINKNHAQLIFTSHDAWSLNNNSLRRDEIWFTEKNDAGVSSIYSLADFIDDDGNKIRKDENLLKNYMLGKYGAIPKLNGLNVWSDD